KATRLRAGRRRRIGQGEATQPIGVRPGALKLGTVGQQDRIGVVGLDIHFDHPAIGVGRGDRVAVYAGPSVGGSRRGGTEQGGNGEAGDLHVRFPQSCIGWPSKSSARWTLIRTAQPFFSGSDFLSGSIRRSHTLSYTAPDLCTVAVP